MEPYLEVTNSETAGCIIVLGAFGIVASTFAYAHWPFNWPSDESATALFLNHRGDFAKIVEMVREDRASGTIPRYPVRIDPGWSDPRNRESQIKNMTEARFAEYVSLFKKLGLRYGLTVGEKDVIECNIACVGLLSIGGGSYKGITYKPDLRFAGVVNSLDDEKLPKKGRLIEDGTYLKAICPDWFVYRKEFN